MNFSQSLVYSSKCITLFPAFTPANSSNLDPSKSAKSYSLFIDPSSTLPLLLDFKLNEIFVQWGNVLSLLIIVRLYNSLDFPHFLIEHLEQLWIFAGFNFQRSKFLLRGSQLLSQVADYLSCWIWRTWIAIFVGRFCIIINRLFLRTANWNCLYGLKCRLFQYLWLRGRMIRIFFIYGVPSSLEILWFLNSSNMSNSWSWCCCRTIKLQFRWQMFLSDRLLSLFLTITLLIWCTNVIGIVILSW